MSHSLEMRVHDDKKLVEVWLTKTEKDDPQVKAELIALYAQYKSKKYMVAVFQSGEQPLYPTIHDLLAYNRRRSAEVAVQRAKKTRTEALER